MTFSGQSAGHEHTVGSILKTAQYVRYVHPTRAGYFHDLHCGWICQAQATGQICRGVGTMPATKSDDLRLPVRHPIVPLSPE
jgi:hypothetical protein